MKESKSITVTLLLLRFAFRIMAQSSDWQSGIWHEPQVRYLLADMCLGGNVEMYRGYGREHDPDSREAIRLWDAGVRVLNTNEIQRCWITNNFGKDRRVMRIVHRGSRRTITGNELLLSSDGEFSQSNMRLVLVDLALGARVKTYEPLAKSERAIAEALRRWASGAQVLNVSWFEASGNPTKPRIIRFKGSALAADGSRVILNSDLPYSEVNVRYFLADIFLGGSRQFYVGAAESAHEMACKEAVERYDSGIKILNLGDFQRKQVDGKTLITRKGGDQRIRGTEVRLSTD